METQTQQTTTNETVVTSRNFLPSTEEMINEVAVVVDDPDSEVKTVNSVLELSPSTGLLAALLLAVAALVVVRLRKKD